mgnify:CR=1 FL=1
MATSFDAGSTYGFSHGLTGITTRGAADSFNLPANQAMAPAEQLAESVLTKLLQGHSLDSIVDDLIRPPLEDRSVLTPRVFRDVLAKLPGLLERAAGKYPEGSEESRALMRAGRQINALLEHVMLASMYQGALVPG